MHIVRYSLSQNNIKITKMIMNNKSKSNNKSKGNCEGKINGGVRMNARIQELQKKLSLNMDKAVLLAEKNTIRNEQGYVVLCKDDEWRDEDEWEE